MARSRDGERASRPVSGGVIRDLLQRVLGGERFGRQNRGVQRLGEYGLRPRGAVGVLRPSRELSAVFAGLVERQVSVRVELIVGEGIVRITVAGGIEPPVYKALGREVAVPVRLIEFVIVGMPIDAGEGERRRYFEVLRVVCELIEVLVYRVAPRRESGVVVEHLGKRNIPVRLLVRIAIGVEFKARDVELNLAVGDAIESGNFRSVRRENVSGASVGAVRAVDFRNDLPLIVQKKIVVGQNDGHRGFPSAPRLCACR